MNLPFLPWEFSLLPNFQKEGLDKTSVFRGGVCWVRGGWLLKNKLKSEIFYRGDCLKRGLAWTVCRFKVRGRSKKEGRGVVFLREKVDKPMHIMDNKAIINSQTYDFLKNSIKCTSLLFSLSKLWHCYPTSSTPSFNKLNSFTFSISLDLLLDLLDLLFSPYY